MLKTIELLPHDQWGVLRLIAVIGPEWNRFMGYILYKRALGPSVYDKTTQKPINDELDKAILDAVLERYPASTMSSKLILWKGETEEISARYQGGTTKDLTFLCYPDIGNLDPAQFVGKVFNSFNFTIAMRVLLGPGSERLQHIENFFSFYLPYDKVEQFNGQIQPL
jgi:hypothetical protein